VVVERSDADWMGLALRLAERGRGQTSPNPMVGSVVVAPDGRAVGIGAHLRAGGPHAEIHALEMAGARARGATLYCSLEPCAHFESKRTPPCCVAISAAGIARVVVATMDPHPMVAGRGLAHLREQRIEVVTGVCAREAVRLNVAFFTALRTHRPWVVLKAATSLDGAVAAAEGARTALTCKEASTHVHRFRAEVDAIGIGSGTLLVDDPRLTVRGVFRDRPLARVVFDSRLRTPPHAALFRSRAAGPILIVTTAETCHRDPARARGLEQAGAELLTAPRHDLRAALALLGARELRSLVLEGGPILHRAAWQAGVVDAVQLFVTPRSCGPDAPRWAMPAGFSLATLHDVRVTPLGRDVLLEGACSRD